MLVFGKPFKLILGSAIQLSNGTSEKQPKHEADHSLLTTPTLTVHGKIAVYCYKNKKHTNLL
jgi:hypothetical protein